jgi:hypothetical protein
MKARHAFMSCFQFQLAPLQLGAAVAKLKGEEAEGAAQMAELVEAKAGTDG